VLLAVALILFTPFWQSLPPGDPGKLIVNDMTQQFSFSWNSNKVLKFFKNNGHNG